MATHAARNLPVKVVSVLHTVSRNREAYEVLGNKNTSSMSKQVVSGASDQESVPYKSKKVAMFVMSLVWDLLMEGTE